MPTVAIIGSGPAGLTSAKAAMECGLTPTVFEKQNGCGGLWNAESGSTWDSLRTNISHYTCMFSDFPWQHPKGDFPTRGEVLEYLSAYMRAFKLEQYVHYNRPVTSVSKMGDKWNVTWRQEGTMHSQTFDHVLVCSGVFSKAIYPQIGGQNTFQGVSLHSKEYKNPTLFKDKKVVVIGNSFSGCEIGAEVASVAQKVVHATSRPFWILPRYLPKSGSEEKTISDLTFYSREGRAKCKRLSPQTLNAVKHAWFRSISPQESAHPSLVVNTPSENPPFVAISDTYIEKVQEGKIEIKKTRIDHIEKDAVVFADGTKEKADAIIYCTGYGLELPFLDQEMLQAIGYDPNDLFQPVLLHKTVFSPKLPGLAFVGLYRGPFFAVMELQARWACMAWSGKIPHPTKEAMEAGIQEEEKIRQQNPKPQFPHGDYVQLADDLAKEIRALPDFAALQRENPNLYDLLWKGFFSPASFRLEGFGKNPDPAIEHMQSVRKK